MPVLYVEQLTVIDAACLDAARGLVGESWIVDLELEGALDAQSMVLDFGEVKRGVKRTIDALADHRLLVPRLAPELSLTERADAVELLFRSDLGAIEHRSPPVAVALIDAVEIDAQALAAHLTPRLAQMLPPNITGLRLHLRHEIIDGACYHYAHGLKKHAGACQRIAHGHRSRVHICVNGARDAALEQALALRWTDIYLGTREDVTARGNGRLRYAYESPEGRFELALPEGRCELIEGDSTVERIAEVIAAYAASLRPGAAIEVRAYQGVMKGAVARA